MSDKFGEIPFSLPHFLAVKSAYDVNLPDKMFMHCKHQPENNEYWERAKKYFEIVITEPPKAIYGNPIYHYAHMSDIVRLNALNWVGGIYMDVDTICVKPFDDFLHHNFVMGKQHDNGLCNALMMAAPKSEFGKLYFESYATFEGKESWDEHGCKMPNTLATLFPTLIHVEPELSFFYPTPWDGLGLLYRKCIPSMEGKYSFHLWESCAWKDYLSKVDENWIRTSNSTYAFAAKRFL